MDQPTLVIASQAPHLPTYPWPMCSPLEWVYARCSLVLYLEVFSKPPSIKMSITSSRCGLPECNALNNLSSSSTCSLWMTGVCKLSQLGVSKNNQLCPSVCCIFCALVSVNTVYHIMVLMNGISLIVYCYLVVIGKGSVMMCFSVWADDVFCCSERDILNLIHLNQMPVILLFVCPELIMAPRSFLLFMASSYDAMFQKSLRYLLF
jgi:hypothetical protein